MENSKPNLHIRVARKGKIMTSEQQYRWAGGSGGVSKPIPRVDKLAKLYRTFDAYETSAAVTREDWMRLERAFLDIRSPIFAAKCRDKIGA